MHSRVSSKGYNGLCNHGQKWNTDDEWLFAVSRVIKISKLKNNSGIFKEIHRKVPSIAVMPKSYVEVANTNFKGDTTNDAYTTGILLLKSDAKIIGCSFAHHKAGAIMCDLNPQNKVYIIDNNIVSAETAGIYIQGKASKPTIKGNKIRFCRSSAIITFLDVDANVRLLCI